MYFPRRGLLAVFAIISLCSHISADENHLLRRIVASLQTVAEQFPSDSSSLSGEAIFQYLSEAVRPGRALSTRMRAITPDTGICDSDEDLSESTRFSSGVAAARGRVAGASADAIPDGASCSSGIRVFGLTGSAPPSFTCANQPVSVEVFAAWSDKSQCTASIDPSSTACLCLLDSKRLYGSVTTPTPTYPFSDTCAPFRTVNCEAKVVAPVSHCTAPQQLAPHELRRIGASASCLHVDPSQPTALTVALGCKFGNHADHATVGSRPSASSGLPSNSSSSATVLAAVGKAFSLTTLTSLMDPKETGSDVYWSVNQWSGVAVSALHPLTSANVTAGPIDFNRLSRRTGHVAVPVSAAAVAGLQPVTVTIPSPALSNSPFAVGGSLWVEVQAADFTAGADALFLYFIGWKPPSAPSTVGRTVGIVFGVILGIAALCAAYAGWRYWQRSPDKALKGKMG